MWEPMVCSRQDGPQLLPRFWTSSKLNGQASIQVCLTPGQLLHSIPDWPCPSLQPNSLRSGNQKQWDGVSLCLHPSSPILSIIVKWTRASSGLVYSPYFSEIGTEANRSHSASPLHPGALAPKPKPRGSQFTSPHATKPLP